MRHAVVQTRFVLDDYSDIPRLVARSSRMVRLRFRTVQALCDLLNLEQGTSGKFSPSIEFELRTARSDCIVGGPCRMIGGSVQMQGSSFVKRIHRNRICRTTRLISGNYNARNESMR